MTIDLTNITRIRYSETLYTYRLYAGETIVCEYAVFSLDAFRLMRQIGQWRVIQHGHLACDYLPPIDMANILQVIAAVAADQTITAQIRITDTGRTVEIICADTGELLAQPRMYGKAESYPAIKQFWAWQRMLGKGGKSEGGGYSASFSMDVGEYFSRRAWWDRMDAQ